MGLPEKFRISDVRTFGTGFDVGESIFWALKKSGRVLLKLLSPTNRRHGGMLRTFRCPYRLENCLGYFAIEAEQRRDGFFFVSDRAEGYFVSSPLEWDCEVLLRKMFGKCLEISYLRYAQSFGDLIGCIWKIRGLDFELYRWRNFIE